MSNSTTFLLQQHTPIIHFQYDQKNASLRATELKPKLDRFILKKLGEGNYEQGRKHAEDNGWLIGKGKPPALDYKVRVKADRVHLTEIRKGERGVSMYFGNMGNDYEKTPRSFSMVEQNLQLEFRSFSTGLITQIDNYFPSFISKTNFGTRQSKGYGSFSISEGNGLDAFNHSLNGVTYLSFNANNYKGTLDVINYYYSRLKSGVNYSFPPNGFCHYRNAFIKLYLNQQGLGYEWGKRWLKEQFLGLAPSNTTKKFARSFLGLSGNYDFRFPKKENPCNEDAGNIQHSRRSVDIKVESVNDDIERFKSPITFKPIHVGNNHWRVYIHFGEIPEGLLGQEFVFSNGGHTSTLFTPEQTLDLGHLLNAYHDHLRTEEGEIFIAQTFKGNPNYRVRINH